MITKQDYLKAKVGTAFYWIDYVYDVGMVKLIMVKLSNRKYIRFWGCDDRRDIIDCAGDVEDVNDTNFQKWQQVEKETQDLIYELE